MYKALNKILKQLKTKKGYSFSSLTKFKVKSNYINQVQSFNFVEKSEKKFGKIADSEANV